jgi:hypothetical protein
MRVLRTKAESLTPPEGSVAVTTVSVDSAGKGGKNERSG